MKLQVLLVLLLHGMFAGAFALSLGDALQSAPLRPAVVTAGQAVAAARRDLARTATDPSALELEKFQAQQRLTLARAQVRQARIDALSEVGTAYSAALLAEFEQKLAALDEALNERYAVITRTQRQRGEATPLEVREAEARRGVAAANRRSAADTARLRRTALRELLPGRAGERLEPVPAPFIERSLPPLPELVGEADATVTLVSARQAVALAQLNVDLSDPRYSAARTIRAAEAQLAGAQATLAETSRSLRAQLRALYAQTRAAQRLYHARETGSAAAQAQFRRQQDRFVRGLIPELELRQSEYAAVAAQLELRRTKHNFVTSLLALQTATATDLWSGLIAKTPIQTGM